MALGGGTFTLQNKTLPGAYINFVSVARARAVLSDRGYAAMGFELDWGVDGEVFEVSNGDFQKYSLRIFGYEYSHKKLKGLRDLFLNLKTLYAYRLNSGEKAENDFATAKYSGIRGNDIKIVISSNVDDIEKFDVETYIDLNLIDVQTVTEMSELLDNDFVVFKKDAEISATAGVSLSGGTNSETVTTSSHQTFLSKIESYHFNVLSYVYNLNAGSTGINVKNLYTSFTKRMRDELGAKFQLVAHDNPSDYEGVINVKNKVVDDDFSDASLCYWVSGISASCEVNRSNLNKAYDGEFKIVASFTQSELEKCIKNGEFTLHHVNDKLRVLSDINSLVTETEEKNDLFKDNQTIRVIDQIANDIAVIFNTRYLGIVPNDKGGRISLWGDIVKHHKQLEIIRAIEDFNEDDIIVEQGEDKRAVVVTDFITVTNAMAKLYMTVKVS